jgi:hypothetical protein
LTLRVRKGLPFIRQDILRTAFQEPFFRYTDELNLGQENIPKTPKAGAFDSFATAFFGWILNVRDMPGG